IDDDRIEPLRLRLRQRSARTDDGIHRLRLVHPHVRLFPNNRQLLNARRPRGPPPAVDTSNGFFPCRVSHFPSLADVVVLPDPWRPSSSTTRGVGASFRRPPSASPNSASISSRTILMTCWPGDRLLRTA